MKSNNHPMANKIIYHGCIKHLALGRQGIDLVGSIELSILIQTPKGKIHHFNFRPPRSMSQPPPSYAPGYAPGPPGYAAASAFASAPSQFSSHPSAPQFQPPPMTRSSTAMTLPRGEPSSMIELSVRVQNIPRFANKGTKRKCSADFRLIPSLLAVSTLSPRQTPSVCCS